jgi:hypothetical protein
MPLTGLMVSEGKISSVLGLRHSSKTYSINFCGTGMRFGGRALMVQFAKYGPNAEKM